MTRVLLVPDLPIERWPSMDRYASRLARGLSEEAPDLTISIAGKIDELTAEDRHAVDEKRGEGFSPRAPTPAPAASEFRRYLNRYWTYPRRVRRLPADLVHVLDHSYAHMLRAHHTTPSLVTVHDLVPVITVQREAHRWRERLRNKLLERVLLALRQARAWIVATNWLRAELAEWLGSDDQIHVIPYGVEDGFFSPALESRDAARRRWGIPDDAFVVLHVGSVGPRKNFQAVLATVDALRQENVDAWLLQVGGALTVEHRTELEERALGHCAVCLGSSSEADLRIAYRSADVLLFPSHYEGFGLPVLEAMASELPVVTSGAGGLDEVGADAAVVVKGPEAPYTSAILRIVQDGTWRNTLVARGVARARRFRWAETARQTAALYRRLG